jgi:hypothetical protein
MIHTARRRLAVRRRSSGAPSGTGFEAGIVWLKRPPGRRDVAANQSKEQTALGTTSIRSRAWTLMGKKGLSGGDFATVTRGSSRSLRSGGTRIARRPAFVDHEHAPLGEVDDAGGGRAKEALQASVPMTADDDEIYVVRLGGGEDRSRRLSVSHDRRLVADSQRGAEDRQLSARDLVERVRQHVSM